MPSRCLFINPEDRDLKAKVLSLSKTPGICIFIDITGSTQMKSLGRLTEWVAKVHNCFANATAFLPSQFKPIKSIGDELMYYVEESGLSKSGYSPLQIYDGLWQLATESGSEFPDVKIGAAWCEDVYPITFFSGRCDYYGIDIDLTARLRGFAKSKQVVIDSRLYGQLRQHKCANDFKSFRQLVGPETVAPKGIPNPVIIYRAS